MLSVFPELFNYSLAAVFVLRATLGLLIVNCGVKKISGDPGKKWKALGAAELAIGICLTIGFLTQIMALATAIIFLGALILKIKKSERFAGKPYGCYIMFLIVSLSLLFLGPGLFSVDLPL